MRLRMLRRVLGMYTCGLLLHLLTNQFLFVPERLILCVDRMIQFPIVFSHLRCLSIS